jgi:hypothetical protein
VPALPRGGVQRLPLQTSLISSSKVFSTSNVRPLSSASGLHHTYRYYMPSLRSSFLPSILTPSRIPSNISIPSSTRKNRGELTPIVFPSGWGRGDIFDWVRDRNTGAIKSVELRKEHDPFQHEYILLILHDDSYVRIDRRPDPDVPVDTLMRCGCRAIDTIQEVTSRHDLPKSHGILNVKVHSNAHLTISHILFICFGVHQDNKANRYTLQRYNCYFFSWTIIVLLLRFLADWSVIPWDGSVSLCLLSEPGFLRKALPIELDSVIQRVILRDGHLACNDRIFNILRRIVTQTHEK